MRRAEVLKAAAVDGVLLLAHQGAATASLAVVANGQRYSWKLNQRQVLKVIESAADSLRRMNECAEQTQDVHRAFIDERADPKMSALTDHGP